MVIETDQSNDIKSRDDAYGSQYTQTEKSEEWNGSGGGEEDKGSFHDVHFYMLLSYG